MIIIINPRQFKKLMQALDNLNSNISALATAVSQIPQSGNTASAAEVQSAADAVAVQTAAINAKLVPLPVPAPAPVAAAPAA